MKMKLSHEDMEMLIHYAANEIKGSINAAEELYDEQDLEQKKTFDKMLLSYKTDLERVYQIYDTLMGLEVEITDNEN